jgi:hypothetical protein
MFVRRLALAIGLLCGLIGTQGPEFAQQYRQRLAGAIDELSRIVGVFDDEAASHALTPHEAIARLRDNPDPLARERGTDVANDISRLDRLKASLAAFRDSGDWRRLVALAEDFDPSVARAAWSDFEPAVPTTTEALVIGGLALVWGWGATHLCAWPIRRHLRNRRGKTSRDAVTA